MAEQKYLWFCYSPLINRSNNSRYSYNEDEDFKLWYRGDLEPCFEYLMFLGILGAVFGVMSAFYAGIKHTKLSRKRKSPVLVVRGVVSFCILVTFLVDFVGSFWLSSGRPYSVMLSLVVLVIAWTMHLFFIWVLSCSVSHYGWGPLNLNAVWVVVFVGSILQVRTAIRWRLHPESYHRQSLPVEQAYFTEFSEVVVYVLFALHCLYGLTIFFKVSRVIGDNVRMFPAHQASLNRDKLQWSEDTEGSGRQHLVTSEWKSEHVPTSYGSIAASCDCRQMREMDFGKIEASEDKANLLSRLLFWWVGPLLRRGALGLLQKPDDLVLLPKSLETSKLRKQFQLACGVLETTQPIQRTGKATCGRSDVETERNEPEDCESVESGDSESWHESLIVNMKGATPSVNEQMRRQRMSRESSSSSLFRSLNRSFGLHYYPLGVLKLVADMLGFAGPLLLYALISFMENRKVSWSVLMWQVCVCTYIHRDHYIPLHQVHVTVRVCTYMDVIACVCLCM